MPQVILITTGWVVVGFVGLTGATILYSIWSGRIDISRIISEVNGDASLSRLQFLIFHSGLRSRRARIRCDPHAHPCSLQLY